jgi:uncharacterized protein (UPF0548 family)
VPVTWSDASRAALLRRVAGDDLTYAEVGATGRGERPTGYSHLRRARVIGRGRSAFEAAAEGLLTWQAFAGAGLGVLADAPRVREGAVVVATLGRPVGVSAPCRVVRLVESEHRAGFSIGTLPGHPETGEEGFDLWLDPGGQVLFEVTSFSRPAAPVVRLAAPLVRLLQSRTVDGYLRALDR